MRKGWATWAVIVALLVSSLWLTGAKCKSNQPAEEQREEQTEQKENVKVTPDEYSVESTGVPVYPYADPDSWEYDLEVSSGTEDPWEHLYGDLVMTTTCPPENVEKWYDEALKGKPGLEKTTDAADGSLQYYFPRSDEDGVTITVRGSEEGSTITVSYKTWWTY